MCIMSRVSTALHDEMLMRLLYKGSTRNAETHRVEAREPMPRRSQSISAASHMQSKSTTLPKATSVWTGKRAPLLSRVNPLASHHSGGGGKKNGGLKHIFQKLEAEVLTATGNPMA